MPDVTIQLSEKELSEIITAYQSIQAFLGKIISPNELYQDEFLSGLTEAQNEVKSGDFTEVKTFNDFIK
jgi:hypothetical protein